MLELLFYFLREIPKRSPGFLLRRGWDELRKNLRYIASLLGRNPYANQITNPLEGASGKILDLKAIDRFVDLLRERQEEELTALLDQADRHGEYKFEIFGSTYLLDRQFLWNQDFATKYLWPPRFHTQYRYAELTDLEHATDIKVPWEIGRLQYLPALALAYRTTGDERHVVAAREIFESWNRANPVGFGIQWVVGMDVALRAISLVLSAELLTGTSAFKLLVDQHFMQSLGDHGYFLYRNIEYSDINGNHHTSCLVGLLYLGVWLEDASEAHIWRAHAVHGLRREILLQTYSDGVCHEGSIPYHRLVTELFLHAFFVAGRVGIDLGDEYKTRLVGMLEFIAAYAKPSGEAPVWGDADDGRVHKLGSQPVNDHRYLMMIGAGLLRRGHLAPPIAQLYLDSALLLDTEALDHLLNIMDDTSNEETSNCAFEQGGFFFLRSSENYCLIDCGDIGLRGRGGHGHHDALSIEIALLGKDVLTDTGCDAYTRSLARRRLCLSANSHNVAVLDECEPAPLSISRWPHANHYPVKVVHWSLDEGVFVGRHYGYTALPDFEYYQRKIEFGRDNAFVITDQLIGSGVHAIKWHFHLAEGISDARIETDDPRLVASNGNISIAIRCDSREVDLSLVDSPIYPTYGLERQRQCLIATIRTALPITVLFEVMATQAEETIRKKIVPSASRSSPAPPSS